MPRSYRLTLAFGAFALLFVSCRHHAEHSAAATALGTKTEGAAHFQVVVQEGVGTYEFAGMTSTAFFLSDVSVSGEGPHPIGTLNGVEIVVEDGVLRSGGRDYGEVVDGDRIEFAEDGVRVSGELRGPLPG